MKKATLLPFLLILATSLSAGTNPNGGRNQGEHEMAAISQSAQADDAVFVVQRCNSLQIVVTVHRSVARSNPVSGRIPENGEPFDWTTSPTLYKNLSEEVDRLSLQEVAPYVENYMNAFGPFHIPSELPTMALYISDKDTCLKAFGAEK